MYIFDELLSMLSGLLFIAVFFAPIWIVIVFLIRNINNIQISKKEDSLEVKEKIENDNKVCKAKIAIDVILLFLFVFGYYLFFVSLTRSIMASM